MDLNKALSISAAGIDAQTMRLRVIAENLANQDTTGSAPGAEAFRGKTINFQKPFDGLASAPTVQVKQIGQDKTAQTLRYDPSNPAANADGYVKTPNVNSFIE